MARTEFCPPRAYLGILFLSHRMAHPKSGFYEKDDHEYVSVSSVLGKTVEIFNPDRIKGLEIWRSMEPEWQEIMQASQRRGTIIHGEIEAYFGVDVFSDDRKLESPTMDEILLHNVHEYIANVLPVLDEIKQHNFSNDLSHPSFLMEEELFCHHGYAGTVDLRLEWDNQYTVWDWKTVRSYKESKKKTKSKSQYKEAFVQIASYALAHNLAVKRGELDREITQGVICVCYDWREPQLHVISKQELKAAAQEFIERFRAYCSLENTQFPRPIQPCSL